MTALYESTVDSVASELLRVPLASAVAGASARRGVTPGTLTSWDLVVVMVRTKQGLEGTGFTYELRHGGASVLAAIREDIAPLVVGSDCWATERLWNDLYWATYNVGRRGAYIHAISALDIALWDLKAKASGVSIARLLGANRSSVPVYESNSGWLNMDIGELVKASANAVEQGIGAVKILVGMVDVREDVARVRAVREAIGSDTLLMVDAAQKWDFRTALDRARRLEEFDLHWIEEPLASDDLVGHERLSERIRSRIASGQTLTTRHEVKPFLDKRCIDVMQVDAARVGGITEWWRIAHMCEVTGVELAPHFLMELHVSLVAASPVGTWVEHTPWLSDVLEDPPAVVDGRLPVPDSPGHGLRIRSDVERWRVL